MPTLNHTPGPWSYNENSANRVFGSESQVVAATYGGIVGEPEQVANTRLIASVPTMYDYLTRKASEGDDGARQILAAIEGIG